MAVIVRACPSFEQEWQRFLEEWRDEGELPLYAALGEFARHLIDMLASRNTERIASSFEAIESLLVNGDEYVQTAAVIGILEALQNNNLHSKTEPEQFRQFLRPDSERWWNKLYDFWDRGKLLSDE